MSLIRQRLLLCALCVERAVDLTLRVTGPCYVLLANVLISAVVYVFYTVLLPLRHPITTSPLTGALHASVGVILVINILFNYFSCIFTNPGEPPAVLHAETALDAEIAEKYARWCKKCRKPKPVFAHHCHVCNRCVTRMDHHCPWMANCVGHYNYRYFFNFLWWLWLGCLYASFMAAPPIPQPTLTASERTGLLFTFIISVAIFLALSCLMGWHVYLVLTAQTTIEFYNNQRERQVQRAKGGLWVNRFDRGAAQNWQEVFDERGKYWWFMWMMPRTRRHSSSGVFWPTVRQKESVGSVQQCPV